MSEQKIILPNPITDYHYSMEYLSKLVGKKIMDNSVGMELIIQSVDKVFYHDAEHPKRVTHVAFKTSYDTYDLRISTMDLIPLIHGGHTVVDAIKGYPIYIIE